MIVDLMAVLKALWGLLTFILLGALKIFYSDFKKLESRQSELEKDVLRLKESAVTKDSIDAILDRKIKHITDTIQDIREDITDMRKEAKEENHALQRDIRELLNKIIEGRK
jgi:septal ring factor EnvC (AmiA/AmiB activator)